jgi:hypothetical protein
MLSRIYSLESLLKGFVQPRQSSLMPPLIVTRWASPLPLLPSLISCPAPISLTSCLRGLTMQHAGKLDENYATCAVNPGHVSKTLDDAALREVIDAIIVAHRTEAVP